MKNQYYIGLGSTFHDPSISIINQNGEILYAEGVERYLQNKRAIGCGADNIIRANQLIDKYCPDPEKIVIGKTLQKGLRNHLLAKILPGLLPLERKVFKYFFNGIPSHIYSPAEISWVQYLSVANFFQIGEGFKKSIRIKYPKAKIIEKNFDHHLSHAAIACHGSQFDNALCLIIDGMGEKGSYAIYHYHQNRIRKVYMHRGLASLGNYYNFLTHLCGFSKDKGEQWKVMGLAPYGKLNPEIYDLLKSLITIKGFSMSFNFWKWRTNLPLLVKLGRKENSPPMSVADLAYTGQYVYSEWVTQLLNQAYKLGLSENLVIAGGCALNSSYNGTILDKTPFKELYVPSAPGDDGGALGASLLAYYEDHPTPSSKHKNLSPFLGSKMETKPLQNLIKFGKIPHIKRLPGKIYQETAKLLAEGKIVGWVQGKAEFGPRALGNRSILADPRSPKMKEEINARVKFREAFRPFAPSILHEFGEAYFENYQYTPYMERTLKFREEVRESLPAVVHANHTGRLQSVTRKLNPQYHQLITEFYKITGVPIVLNTSFNVMGKPIIHSVEDAVSVFYTTGLDALVIGEYLITKEERKERRKELEFIPSVSRM